VACSTPSSLIHVSAEQQLVTCVDAGATLSVPPVSGHPVYRCLLSSQAFLAQRPENFQARGTRSPDLCGPGRSDRIVEESHARADKT